jgi:hypothetical protein
MCPEMLAYKKDTMWSEVHSSQVANIFPSLAMAMSFLINIHTCDNKTVEDGRIDRFCSICTP